MDANATTGAVIRAALLWIASVAGGAAAQQEPSGTEPKQPLRSIGRAQPESQRVLLEEVIGVIHDRAILASEVRAELDAWITGETNREGKPPSVDRVRIQATSILAAIESKEALAQQGRALSGTTRERVDALVRQLLEDDMREEEERAGSINKLRDELGILGQTFESQQDELRTEHLAQLAMQDTLQRRWNDRMFSLAVTPTEMRRYYDQHLDEFVGTASADLAVVVIRAGSDAEAAHARAAEAATAWRAEKLTAAEIAERFAGFALEPLLGVRNDAADQRQAAIKEFAGRAAAGEVSDPIATRESFLLLRIERRTEGRNQPFSDRDVQASIHQRLVVQRIQEEQNRVTLKSRKRFEPIRPRPPSR